MGYYQDIRDKRRAKSNNPRNTNKNVCSLAVANALGVGGDTRYLHTMDDLKYAIRKRWSCRSVKSALKVEPYQTTVTQAVKAMRKHKADNLVAYVVYVPGHVLLIDESGDVAVDTDPRKGDRRRVGEVYGVYRV